MPVDLSVIGGGDVHHGPSLDHAPQHVRTAHANHVASFLGGIAHDVMGSKRVRKEAVNFAEHAATGALAMMLA